MFRRLILSDYAELAAIVAFATVAAIFLSMTWRAIRMSRGQADRFAQLPFASDPSRPSDSA